MRFGDKAPRFLSINALEQLHADTVHLGSMSQHSLFLAGAFERDGSCMERIVTSLTERQQIRFLLTAVLAPKDDVVNFQAFLF